VGWPAVAADGPQPRVTGQTYALGFRKKLSDLTTDRDGPATVAVVWAPSVIPPRTVSRHLDEWPVVLRPGRRSVFRCRRPTAAVSDPRAVGLVKRPASSAHQWWATSMTRRDSEPGPVRAKTRNGSRARTPRPIVVCPSNEPAPAIWRNVAKPETSTSSDLVAGNVYWRHCVRFRVMSKGGRRLHTPVPRRRPGGGRRPAASRDRVGVMAAVAGTASRRVPT
jgi:hypothetical protein